jgi:hypothetical protein
VLQLLLLLLLLLLLQGERCEVHQLRSRLSLRAVALGDNSTYVISYEDGDLAWSAGLSDGLYDTLKMTRKYKREVESVALGRNQGSSSYNAPSDPGEVYFLRRNTHITYLGEQCARGLINMWQDGDGDDFVVKVSFAPSNGWFAVDRGGSANWEGLPDSLHKALDAYWDDHDGVKALSVGHNGEWFVKWGTGAWSSKGVHPELKGLLDSSSYSCSTTGAVEWVELGPNHTFVALFEWYTAWYGSNNFTEALMSCM